MRSRSHVGGDRRCVGRRRSHAVLPEFRRDDRSAACDRDIGCRLSSAAISASGLACKRAGGRARADLRRSRPIARARGADRSARRRDRARRRAAGAKRMTPSASSITWSANAGSSASPSSCAGVSRPCVQASSSARRVSSGSPSRRAPTSASSVSGPAAAVSDRRSCREHGRARARRTRSRPMLRAGEAGSAARTPGPADLAGLPAGRPG